MRRVESTSEATDHVSVSGESIAASHTTMNSESTEFTWHLQSVAGAAGSPPRWAYPAAPNHAASISAALARGWSPAGGGARRPSHEFGAAELWCAG